MNKVASVNNASVVVRPRRRPEMSDESGAAHRARYLALGLIKEPLVKNPPPMADRNGRMLHFSRPYMHPEAVMRTRAHYIKQGLLVPGYKKKGLKLEEPRVVVIKPRSGL